MKFSESDRTHQVGKDKGKPILISDIKSANDMQKKVKDFFDDGYLFYSGFIFTLRKSCG